MQRDTTAKRLAKKMKEAIPGLEKLSVTGHKYLEGNSLDVKWTGPLVAPERVLEVANGFEGYTLHDQTAGRMRFWKDREAVAAKRSLK